MKRKLSGLAIKRRVLRWLLTGKPNATEKDVEVSFESIPIVKADFRRGFVRVYRYNGQEYREEDNPAMGSLTIAITRAKKGGRA